MASDRSPLAPTGNLTERVGTVYEAKMAPNRPGVVGPLRFEEGLASDTDIPDQFTVGVMQGYVTGARPNQNRNVYEKPPEETMRERAHVGSASWVEAPTHLGEFARGTDSVVTERKYEMVDRGAPNPDGRRFQRHNAAQVRD
jgi:hypothetical protein